MDWKDDLRRLRLKQAEVAAVAPQEPARAPQRRSRTRTPVKDFMPAGRSSYCLYAVALKEHPGVVKVGRTTRWKVRRKTYADWNLRNGDAIAFAAVFELNEEFVDLAAMERAILERIDAPRRHGNEWIEAELADIVELIDTFLMGCGVTYTAVSG